MINAILCISFLCTGIAGAVAQQSNNKEKIHSFLNALTEGSISDDTLLKNYFKFSEQYQQSKSEIDSLLFSHFNKLRDECNSGFEVLSYEEARGVDGFVDIIDDDLEQVYFIRCQDSDLYPIKINKSGKIVSFALLNKAGRKYFIPF